MKVIYKVIKHTKYGWNTHKNEEIIKEYYTIKYRKMFMGIPFWKDFCIEYSSGRRCTSSSLVIFNDVKTIEDRFKCYMNRGKQETVKYASL